MLLVRRALPFVMGLLMAAGVGLPVHAQDGSQPDPLGGATEFAKANTRTAVTLILDWTPNTNHTGFYVAQALGYFDEANLDVTIQEPTDLLVEAVVASGAAQFGVSYQEYFTYARADKKPLVSVAAIIQHNTSGFVSLHDRAPISRPADFAGLRYGGFGQPDLEKAIINSLIVCDGGQPDSFEYIDVGYVDPFDLMQRDRIDFVWMYYGWSGIEGKLRGLNLDTVMLRDYFDCIPDYYTPILITSEDMIAKQPDVVAAFVQATARGFAYAIQSPADAADILIKAAPEDDPDLIRASADWLAPLYQADAPRWGQQSVEIWQGFSDFLVKNKILDTGIDAQAAFTNDFLPGTADTDPQKACGPGCLTSPPRAGGFSSPSP
jgi:ABC-type nitrate/sulfonate/bicarbonate transport system substrate-binding protein